MIKCHLSRMMGERKKRIADLSRELDLARNTLALLYSEKAARVDLDVVDKLCGYFGCPVGELFERIPDPEKPKKRR